MPFARTAAAFFAAVIVSAAMAVPALAQEAKWELVEYVLHDEQGQAVLIVSGSLPEDVALPADVTLAVPAGAQLSWVGEILGGAVADDPSVEAAKSTSDGVDVYSFTLAKSRIGQLEVNIPPAIADGATISPVLSLAANQDIPEVRVGVRIPQGSRIVRPQTGAQITPGPEGYSYYSTTMNDVKSGDPISVAFSYEAPAQVPAQAAAPDPVSSVVLPIILLLVVVAAGATIAIKVSAKLAAKSRSAENPGASAARTSSVAEDARTEADADEADVTVDAGDDEPRRRSKAPIVIVVGGLAVAVIAFLVVGQANKPQSVDGTFTANYPGVGACTSSNLQLTPAAGVDLAKQGDKLVDSLAGVESVGNVTLYIAESRMTVEYCESSTSEEQIKQVLASTGLVTW